jgi:beta-barrel assembly-enhancing protease
LLTELNSEAELAAVLGHEITHATARHGAKSMERQIVLQGGLLATNIAIATTAKDGDHPLKQTGLMAGASVAAAMVATRYGWLRSPSCSHLTKNLCETIRR